MAKKSLKDVKVNNTAQVLECIIKNDQVSRIEISEKTKLSPSTVSQAVALLIEKGIAEEICSGESTGGRDVYKRQGKDRTGGVAGDE